MGKITFFQYNELKQKTKMSSEKLPGAAYDNKIYAKFSKNTIDKKVVNKKSFCEEFGLECHHREFLIGIVAPLTPKNGADILEKLLEGIATLPFRIAVRAIGTKRFQDVIGDFAEHYPHRIVIVADNDEGLRKILASSDATIFLAGGQENEALIRSALAYAAIPIAPAEVGHLVEDYNPNQESGTGFLYAEKNPWSAFAALVRAGENFRFPYDWKTIQKSAIET